ncbi:hypothetical protein [Sulfurospirillum cavolei]|uniref:hypothetical protein n=1 Tax=Sulfurospirillum cavolei TaxID=366522 RepID=UPI0007648963|nr:hypothetical protein [Sulfurospirillum cavolei]
MLSHSEINELEKKLSKYRLKRTLFYGGTILIGISVVATLALLFFLYRSDASKPQEVQTPHETTIREKENNASSTLTSVLAVENNMTKTENTIPDKHQEQSKEEILRLRLPDTLNKTSTSDKKAYTPPPEDFDTPPLKKKAENELDLPVLKRNGNSEEQTFYRNKEEQIDATLLPPPPPLEETKPKGVIKIESQEINSISYLKEKFDTTHNIVFALMLAEEYYLSKNYVESNKWALIANNLDAENEKSWIWFAKSKLKLGQKEDAILALKTYLKNTKSQAAQSLLNQITLGEPIQ